MDKRSWAVIALAAALGAILLVLAPQPKPLQAQAPQPRAMPLDATSIRLTLRSSGPQMENWDGSVTASAGRVLGVETGGVRLSDASWQASVPAQAQGGAAKKKAKSAEPRSTSVVVTLAAPDEAQITVTTRQGDFAFRLGSLHMGAPKSFLDGRALAERVPLSRAITMEPTEDDFPALAVAPDGKAWCAFVSYEAGNPVDEQAVLAGKFDSLLTKGNQDQVRLMAFAAGEWSAPLAVTDAGLDVWRPAVAADGAGNIWVIWSQNANGNWDLYARSYHAPSGRFSKTLRLTTDPGADLNVVAAGRSEGGAWIAWQGWRNNQFDIWFAGLNANGVGTPIRISTSAANDWSPSLALGSPDQIWIAWDTFDRGNYDVWARSVRHGKPEAPIPIAASARFEARPSIAADSQGRLWIAYEEAGENWGKDYGDRWPGRQGVPFYLERTVRVRVLDKGRLLEPQTPFQWEPVETAYDDPRRSPHPAHRTSLPRIAVDSQDRLWLAFRRHQLASGAGERWSSFVTSYAGDAWSPVFALPDSTNTLDTRPALAAFAGGLLAVYSSDARRTSPRDRRDNALHAAFWKAERPQATARLNQAQAHAEAAAAPIHPDEAAQVARMRAYRIVAGGKTYRLLRGEFHRHTEYSSHRDWDGPIEEVFRYGLDVAAMDWIGPGDHDYGSNQEYLWWLTQKQVDLYHHPARFVPVFTYERSIPYPSGHRNILFARRGIRPLPRQQSQERLFGAPETGSADIRNLYAYLKAFGGICSSHTSATNMGTDWRDNDPQVEPVVEIYQGHRQNYEETNAPLAARGEQDTIQGYRPLGFVWNALQKGYRLGFQASSDHVSTHISYAVVLAEEHSRAGILEAFQKRHSYAAHDNIVLDVRSGAHVMGDEFTSPTPPELQILAEGTARIRRVDIIRQRSGERPAYAAAFQPNQRIVKLRWRDADARPGETTLYYVRLEQENFAMAWASPMWIRYQPSGR